MRAITNGGHQDSHLIGDLPGFFPVWFNKNSMLNILSFAQIRKVYRITIDTDIAATMNVHLHNGNIMTFTEVDSGLYIFKENIKQDMFTFLTLISENRSNYSKRELKGADMARDLHLKIGYPGYQKFFKLLETNFFRNCPLTSDDAKRSLHINGPDTLKGKMTRPSASKIKNVQQIRIPKTITETHSTVNLSADFLFIQCVVFLHTISRGFEFCTIEMIHNRKVNTNDMKNGLRRVILLYHARGIHVNQINTDNEFECIKNDILPTNLNVVAAEKHVGEIERSIRIMKEGTRRDVQRHPYSHYPKVMIKGSITKKE